MSKSVLKRKNGLIAVLCISAGVDFITSATGLGLAVPSVFSSFMIEEMIEWLFSSLAVRYILDDDLSTFEQVAGFIPIPGVTALTIKCVLELIKLKRNSPTE